MIPEPENGAYVLVNGDGVWHRDDKTANENFDTGLTVGFDHPEYRWWLLDGGSWSLDPEPWAKLVEGARTMDVLEPTDRLKP